jgi:hypothetical protein
MKTQLKYERTSHHDTVNRRLEYAKSEEAHRDMRVFDLLVIPSLLQHEERIRALEEGLRVRMRLDEDWP